MPSNPSSRSLSGLPIGSEVSGSDELIALFCKERDPDLWHLCVTQMNPDTGVVYGPAMWMIKQPEVDRATAMFLLNLFGWNIERSDGRVYPVYAGGNEYNYPPGSDGPKREEEAFNLAVNRLRRDDFSRAELSSPKFVVRNEADAREFEPKILLRGQPGREPRTPWKLLEETGVVYDPHDTVFTPYWM